MSTYTDKVDEYVLSSVRELNGLVTSAQLFEVVTKDWPFKNITPTHTGIGYSMARLGFEKWRDRKRRGWCIGTAEHANG